MMAALVGGCSVEEASAIISSEPFPDDAVAVCTEVGDAQVRAFSEPGALDRICHHPAGDFPGAVMLAFSAGPSGTVSADAPLQTRLLDAMGRRP